MITTAILYLLYGAIYLLTSPLRLLGDATLPTEMSDSLTQASHFISNIDFIFPIGILITIVGVVIGIEVSIAIYKVIMWVIRKIPTIS